jgi:hypothetical protein
LLLLEPIQNTDHVLFVIFSVWTNQTTAAQDIQGESQMRFLMTARAACIIALFATCEFATTSFAQDAHTTNQFHGVKVNGGTVTHSKQGDRDILTLSDDFKVPDVPDAHWQVIDSKGNVYTLERLQAKNGKFNSQSRCLPTSPTSRECRSGVLLLRRYWVKRRSVRQ